MYKKVTSKKAYFSSPTDHVYVWVAGFVCRRVVGISLRVSILGSFVDHSIESCVTIFIKYVIIITIVVQVLWFRLSLCIRFVSFCLLMLTL
jgi:hypothetical protein